MTITYDPHDPLYTDEADTRDEMTRVFDVCRQCGLCVDLCGSFPTLFEMIDRHDDREAGLLTPAQQDTVVDQCVQCKLCAVRCPYAPSRHEAKIDFPRLMLRAVAMRRDNGQMRSRAKWSTQVIGRTDLVGSLATRTSPLANRVVGAKPGSLIRKVAKRLTGVSAVRALSPFTDERFTAWFKERPRIKLIKKQGSVTLYPTCLVEYHETDIGKDLVKVYERNGIECRTTDAGCCGAPWLHAGDVKRFVKVAEGNVRTLAADIRKGTDVVVPQPTCSYVLKHEYPVYVGAALAADAEVVATRTFDAAEYLMRIHEADDTVLDTDFAGRTHRSITYHAPCHLRAQNIGLKSRDLMKLTGARVTVVQQCSGVDGLWSLRSDNDDVSIPMSQQLGEKITRAGTDAIAGDCHLANRAIAEHTGVDPAHPIQVLARAYGIPPEHR